MAITARRYSILADFNNVYNFLQETYDYDTLNSYLLPQYFEYAHCHPLFDYHVTHRNGVWEDDGKIVGVVCYEMNPKRNENHLHVSKGYEHLLPQMVDWAEAELFYPKDDKRLLRIWITSRESNKQELLKARGYELTKTYPVTIFDYKNDFVERVLPEGFTMIDGTDVDYVKLQTCYWKGFNHEGTPKGSSDDDIMMCNAPKFDKTLQRIVVAPNGDYACALGMWLDERNKYAYLEPLATVPEYRRMGLAAVALTDSMKATKERGARYCFGGGMQFYYSIGFEEICKREMWEKVY